jgi:hypothetical protein
MSTYLQMLETAWPHIAPLLVPSDVWIADVHHDDGCARIPCACKPEIVFTRMGESKPLIRLTIVEGQLAIDVNEAAKQ